MGVRRLIKAAAFVSAGLVWTAAGLFLAVFSFTHVIQARSPFDAVLGLIPAPLSAGMGMMHFIGLALAAVLSVLVGIVMCAHGIVPSQGCSGHRSPHSRCDKHG